jgi:hypothetical protein
MTDLADIIAKALDAGLGTTCLILLVMQRGLIREIRHRVRRLESAARFPDEDTTPGGNPIIQEIHHESTRMLDGAVRTRALRDSER